MSNRAWMPLHIDTYLADTGYLTAAEHGAYMLLIMTYWRDGGLPEDERMIARIARMSKDEWAESRDVIASFFKDGWRHSRIDEELAKADEIIEKRRNAALGRHQKSKPDASAVQVQSKSTDTGVPPRTFHQDPKEEPIGSSKKRGCRLPADFVPDIGFAISLGLSRSQADNEAIKFREWWPAQPGQKGIKLDWGLTWQTWCRKALERGPRGSPAFSSQPKGADYFDQRADDGDAERSVSRSQPDAWRDDAGLPVLTIEHFRRHG